MVRSKAVAKLAPPRPTQLFLRERLAAELDRMRRDASAIWISAPAGAGKTSLCASYLVARKLPAIWFQVDAGDSDTATFFHFLALAAAAAAPNERQRLPALSAEYQADLTTYARNFFRRFCARLPQPSVIVLDNYQDAGESPALHDVVRIAIGELPAGLHLLVVSRTEPPAQLARLRVGGALANLDGVAMQLTAEESAAICALRAGERVPGPAALAALHARADGWAAGLVLLLEQSLHDGAFDPARAPAGRLLFDYFAAEVFARIDHTTQAVLLRCSLFDRIAATDARAISGRDEAPALLDALARRNFFVVRRDSAGGESYECHPLFRDFLRAQAKHRYGRYELDALRRQAADLLRSRGEIDAAITLRRRVQDWDGVAQLIAQAAPGMLAQGRSRLVLQWADDVPPAQRQACAWLLFWEGAARLDHDPALARASLERAYASFCCARDAAGAYAAWCRIVETYVLQRTDFRPVRRWLTEVERLQHDLPMPDDAALEAEVACAMFMGMMWARPNQPEISRWYERVQQLLFGTTDLRLHTLVAHQFFFYQLFWRGDIVGAGVTLRMLEPRSPVELAPLARVAWLVGAAHYHLFAGSSAACLAAAHEGLQIADEHGVHAWDSFLATLPVLAAMYIDNDLRHADVHLARLLRLLVPGRPVDAFVEHSLLGWRRLFGGELDQAEQHLRTAVQMAEERVGDESRAAFFPQLWRTGLAMVLLRRRQAHKALALVRSVLEPDAGVFVSPTYETMGQLVIAEAAADDASSLQALRLALSSAHRRGVRMHLGWDAAAMARLYAKALQHDIERDYVRLMIRERALPAPEGCTLEAWPFAVRVFTLGRFELRVDDQPLTFSGKVPKKPIELLKALIALGGRDVREDRLTDLLWPDADPGTATHALATAVYRLRKLLGDAAITRQEGRLSIAAGHCWVDAWALERCLAELERAAADGQPDVVGAHAEHALDLYRGAFLSTDPDAAWALSPCERLRRKLLHGLDTAGRALLDAGRAGLAITCHERALDLDPVAESLYRGLMRALATQGLHAEALAAYERCHKALAAHLGIEPAPETTRLAELLRGAEQRLRSVSDR